MTLLRDCGTLAVTLLCLVSFSSCAERRLGEPGHQSGGADKHFDKTFTVNPGGKLLVRTDVGNVSVQGSEGNSVVVSVEMRGRDREISRFDVSAEQRGNDVEVRGDMKDRAGSWFSGGDGLDATFKIQVPRQYNVEIHTSGGTVEVATVSGTLNGGTSGGDLRVRDVEGPVNMETSGGNVMAEKVTGNLRMRTSGGDIRMSQLTGDIETETSGGNIFLEGVNGKVVAGTSGGNVRVRVNGVNKGIRAETSGGNIELTVAKNTAANLNLSTSGGNVTCDLPVTVSGRISEDNIRGTVNGGGPEIYAHTSGGNVDVRPE